MQYLLTKVTIQHLYIYNINNYVERKKLDKIRERFFSLKGPGEPQEQHDHGHAQEVLHL